MFAEINKRSVVGDPLDLERAGGAFCSREHIRIVGGLDALGKDWITQLIRKKQKSSKKQRTRKKLA